MMDNLRASANHVVLKIILGLIILSFVLTGVGSYLTGGNNNYAAKVNDREISRSQFENAVAGERNRLQQQMGNRYSELAGNDGYIKAMRQQMLQRLIDESLMDQYAQHLGLSISDEQVKEAIFKEPAFQINGHFDNARYNSILTNMGMSPDQYAQALRNQLTTQQLINSIVGTDFMLTGETDELAALVSQQRVVRTATLNIDALAAKQQASNEEINAWYAQHQEQYVAPEQFRVSYLKLDAANMRAPVTEQDIQTWYDENRDQYTQPAQYRFSVIQTKTEQDANAVLQALKSGGDFAALAKAKSTDIISAHNGGDMGWMEASMMPDELKNAGLKDKGQLSGVIKSSVGFLVARLDDIKPQQIKPLAEVHDAIADKVKQDKAIDAFYALQQKVSEAASNDNQSLVDAEKVAGIKAIETGWISRNNLPAELNFKPVSDAIFNGGLLGEKGTPGSNSDIITVDGNQAFVLRITEHKAEAVKPLAEVRDQVAAAVTHQKAVQQAQIEANKLLEALKSGKGDAALKAAGLNFSKPETLSRMSQNPISQAAFALAQPQPGKITYGTTSDTQGNVVIIALDKVLAGTMPEEQKKVMVNGITQNNAQVTFEALMNNLRKDAKIKIGEAVNQ